ncbi:MAG: hypothetical protein COU69_03475 [Candidatus Pacebacteria bacterium CG10_big_fil_rev_8_21_14_0_10_56_10]|nr:MAG: hypothetical protein COU69_03475 [Candidatus Pacebacteria bacterium CG10_big_fil_rev_8_21_14_0_10_56_10]
MSELPSDLHATQVRNVTISGLPGAGSTTLLVGLKEELKFDGWKGFNGGEFMREYAKEKGLFKESAGTHHDASHYEDDFDRQVDYGMREKLQAERHWILESWLSGFMAQGLDGVLKILMVCSDDAVRIDRIVNRDQIGVEEAKHNLHQRYHTNMTKWRRLYRDDWQRWVAQAPAHQGKDNSQIDFWRRDLYDLVIDTYSNGQEETLRIALNAIISPAQN